MGFEAYSAYLSVCASPNTPTQQYKNQLQAMANQMFDVSSNHYIVKHRKRIDTVAQALAPEWIDVGVRLVTPFEIKQTNLIKDDFFNIIFKDFDYPVFLGDIFEFNRFRWMVVNTSNIKSTTNSVLVQRCNVVLKFTEQEPLNSDVIEIDAIANKFIINSLKDEQFITLPDNKLSVMIPNDFYGIKVKSTDKGGTRFLLGKPYKNWRTTSFDNILLSRTSRDNIVSGIIKLQIELSEINTGMDDLVNGVAWQDYF
jgi:hypothetical protein